MYYLPLYSFGRRGLAAKPEHLLKEYVCVENWNSGGLLQNPGKYRPVEVKMHRWPLTEETAVALCGGVRVACCEDIGIVGRLTQRGYGDLVLLWEALMVAAQEEVWR